MLPPPPKKSIFWVGKVASWCKHCLRTSKWLLTSWAPSADAFIWRAQTIWCSLAPCVDRRLGAKSWTPQQKHAWQDRVSVIDLKFSSWSWRVLNHHGHWDGGLEGLGSFWFKILFFFLSLRVLASPLWLSPLWKTSNCTVSDHPLSPPYSYPSSVKQSSQPRSARAS